MSETLAEIRRLVEQGQIAVSQHAKGELDVDRLGIDEVLGGVQSSEMIDDYPDYFKGPCVLVLQRDRAGQPIHALWGIKRATTSPAVLVTVYRPDPRKWSRDFKQRQP